jgi:hypothetical protein
MDNLEVKIEAPEGFEIDRDNSTIDCIRFKKKDDKWVKNWEELGRVDGCYITTACGFGVASECYTSPSNRNIFATTEQAKAMLAMAQLTQLMKRVNGDWVPNWTNKSEDKHIIYVYRDVITTETVWHSQEFLAFQLKENRDKFLAMYKDLIEEAKPLL